jgi:hypothetical protein
VRRSLAFVTLALALPLASCDRKSDAASDAGPPPVASAPPAPSARAPSPVASAEPEAESVQLLKLTMTSSVKDKEPVDEVQSVAPGERVYAHLKVRNRTGFTRTLDVRFRVNGVERSTVSLEVEPSWSWRTWAYNTVLPTDPVGALVEMDVTDDTGAEVASAKLPIRKRAK